MKNEGFRYCHGYAVYHHWFGDCVLFGVWKWGADMMDDLISRQAAIDALHMHLMYRMGTDSNKKRLDDWINGVPSAQPEYTEQNVRDSFNSGYACGMEAAQSEIIRCRDCRYGVDYYHDGNCYCAKPGYELLYFDGSWDFYCANAERRT